MIVAVVIITNFSSVYAQTEQDSKSENAKYYTEETVIDSTPDGQQDSQEEDKKKVSDFLIMLVTHIQEQTGINEVWITLLAFVTMILIAVIVYFILKKLVIERALKAIFKKTKTNWDDVILERGVFKPLILLAPVVILYFGMGIFPDSVDIVRNILNAMIAILIVIRVELHRANLVPIFKGQSSYTVNTVCTF